MWFSTAAGISSFDGFQWKNYNSKDGLIESGYKYIHADEKGILWSISLFVEDGIFKYNKGKWEKFTSPPVTAKSRTEVTAFAVLYKGENPVFGIGTTNGLFVLNDNKWNCYVKNKENKPEFINCLNAKDNIFFAGSVNGIFEVDIHCNKRNFVYDKLLPDKVVRGIIVSHPENNHSSGTFFILGLKWLLKIKDGSPEILFKDENIPWETDSGTGYLVYDNKNTIYFGNNLVKYSFSMISGEIKSLLKKNGFTSNRATNIFIDKENNVWFTDFRGIDKISNLQVNNYYESSGLLENEVTSVIEIKKGTYVFGHNGGLTYMNNSMMVKVPFKMSSDKQMLLSRIQDLTFSNDGNVWIAASRRGFGKWSAAKGLKWISGRPNEGFFSTACDADENVWVLSDLALYLVKNDQLVKMAVPADKAGFVRKIFCFKGDKSLYLVGGSGVYRFSHQNVESLFPSDKNSELSCYALFKSSNNEFLVGSEKGVFILKDKKLSKYIVNNETISSPVYFIVKDKNENIWFGTDNGVIISSNGRGFQRLSIDHGLAGRETNRDGGFVDSFGRIWVGTDKGVSCFDNDFKGIDIPVPSLMLIEGECHDGTTFPLNKNINLNSTQNTIRFNFRGISYINEDSIIYLVKLSGYDNEWQLLSQQQLGDVTYKNLPPGNYQLFVKAKNSQGEWSAIKESGIITILSPVYVRWWFILIIIAIIGAFVFYRKLERKYFRSLEAAVRERTKELEESRNILEQRVKERTVELAMLNERKDKFFSIVAHDLKNPFQALLGFDALLVNQIDSIPPEEVRDIIGYMSSTIHRFYSLLENLLTWARIQMNRVEFTKTNIDLNFLIKEISIMLKSIAQKKNIQIETGIPEGTVISADENMMKSILQNIVSNGIKFTRSGGSVKIGFKTNEKEIMIIVSDNGVGMSQNTIEDIFKIDMLTSSKGTEGEMGTGLGLKICKEMVMMHEGDITVTSEEGSGSTFTIHLPK